MLYVGIVAATLVSGQYIACGAMNWMLVFWRRRYQAQLTSARQGLLGELIDLPRYARLATPEPGSTRLELRVEELKPDDVIVVSAGERMAVDGRVLEGRALVDERLVRGVEGLVRKGPGDDVWAGSTVRAGELRALVVRPVALGRSARLARAMIAAIAPAGSARAPTRHGEAFAEQAVAPTLAAAGLGLFLGDASTAVAIMRPDYATGAGLAFPLETLQAIALLLRHGVVIRHPEAIERLATADVLVLDHHPALERTELELASVEVFPGCSEEQVLGYAASAFRELDDERTSALLQACRARGTTPRDFPLIEVTADLTLRDQDDVIKVGDLGARARPGLERAGDHGESLMVGVNGRVLGLVHFRRSKRLAVAPVLRRLRSRGNLQLGLVSDQAPEGAAALAAALDCDFHLAGQSADDRLQFLRQCRREGLRVLYVGNCRTDPRVVTESHAAISLFGEECDDFGDDPAPFWLLQPRLAKLGPLWDVASIHRRRLKVAHGYALLPNLLCVAGAFAWGFTSLVSVLLSNLGTYGIYSRTTASLETLDREMTRSFGPRARMTGEDRRGD